MAVIEVRALHKEYGRRRKGRVVALAGVDFDVPEGEVFGFLGPNGAGKTTAIRCLLNLVRPTSGQCLVLGVDPRFHMDRIQHRIGALTEAQALFPAFSGRRNLLHLAYLGGVPSARVDEVLERVGLAARAGDRVGDYSLGMRQRLGIAAALLKDPELLILDEPANGLDPAGIVEIRNLLRRLGDEGRTVFVSSHQLLEVQQICDRVAVLANGRCVAAGPVDGILASVGSTGIVVSLDDVSAGLQAVLAAGLEAWVDDDHRLRVALPARDGDRVAQILAAHGLFPRELRPAGATLEEAFLALTRRSGPPP